MATFRTKINKIIHQKRKALLHPLRLMEYLLFKEKKFIIFTWPRCGSTNLAYILREYYSHSLFQQRISCLVEPFTKELHGNEYLSQTHDLRSFKKCIKNIFYKYTGFKHLSGVLPFKYEKYLLSGSRWKIIFLWRKNCLQRQLSCYIATQTKYPYKSPNQQGSSHVKGSLKPADISYIKKELISYK